MLEIIREINLDVSEENRFTAITAKQYDSRSRYLLVRLTDRGEALTLPDTASVLISATRPDGLSDGFEGLVQDGAALVPLDYWMLMLDGTVTCELVVTGADGYRLTTMSFALDVRHSCFGDGPTPGGNHGVYVRLLEEIEELKKKIGEGLGGNGTVTDEQINAAVEKYLTEHPLESPEAEKAAESAKKSAEDAEASASEAKTAADEAGGSARTAEQSASSADGSASLAASSAKAAATNAERAGTANTAAETAKSGAESARDEAKQSANNAAGSANSAATSASNASGSATTAQTAAAMATEAKEAAETAKNGATTAQSAAEKSASNASASAQAAQTAQAAAESAKSTAAQKATDAENAAQTAATAATGAAEAKTAAEKAASDALAHKEAAQTAQLAAEKAKSGAEQAATNASASAGTAGESATTAQNAARSAVSAKEAAETAKTSAEGARDEAGQQATTAANAAQTAATAATGAVEAKTAAERAASDALEHKEAVEKAKNEVEQKLSNGDYKGEDGKTYTPHVATDGTIFWTNDGDLPNPDPVNLIELMRDELGLEEDAGETVEYESFATEDELVAGGDTSKLYVVEETGTLWAYQTVEVGEVRKQIFDPASKIIGHMSGTKISSAANELYLLPVDTSQIPEGEVAYLEVNGIYKKTSSSTPQSQKIGYSALNPDSIAVAENQLVKCYYTETRATAGTDYPTDEEITETSTGMTVKVGYFSGTILDGYDTIKTMLIETGAIADASAITAYLVHDGGTTKQWVDTGEAPPAPGTNTNYTDLLLRVNQAEANIHLHDSRITKLETQSDATETFDDYWQTAYDAAVAKVKAKQDEGGVNVECFVWFSDLHYHTSNKHILNVGRLSAAIMDACDIPFAILSGDTLTAATLDSEALVRQYLRGAISLLSPIGEDRLLLARGNHDDVYGRVYNEDGTTKATYVNKVSATVMYNELHRWQALDHRRVYGDTSGTYYYIDTPQHTRHIILNCQYYDGGAITNGTVGAMTTGMGETQLAWLKDKALAVDEGVTVTITLHFPPTSQNINGHTYWIDGWPDDASAFRAIIQESTADIAAIFCGHCHADAVVTGDLRCPIITTTCAINTPYDADPATRVIGTDTETAINIVCIDKREDVRKIDVIRLGYGADRLNISY